MKTGERKLSALSAALLAIGFMIAAPAGAQSANSGTSGQASTTGTTGMSGSKATSGNSSLPHADHRFVTDAAEGGLAEVQLGQLAAQKAQNPQVKQFGQRMVDDHSKANTELKRVASDKGVSVPTDLQGHDKREYDKLEKLSGADFDREYMKNMVKDHEKDVKDFQKEAQSGNDQEVRGFASKTLPTLEEHLNLAKSTEAAVRNGGNR